MSSELAARFPRFRNALASVPPLDRDRWADRVLGLDGLPDDGRELPQGCVPYLPCPVDTIVRAVDLAGVQACDVFVDVGAGVGRAAVLAHLLTGASAIAIEVQPAFVLACRELAARLRIASFSAIEGDAAQMPEHLARGSVFFLYCPFGGARLAKVLSDLEVVARTRSIRVCCVDLPLPPCPWLTLVAPEAGDLAVYRSSVAR